MELSHSHGEANNVKAPTQMFGVRPASLTKARRIETQPVDANKGQ
jgi:hypothetical protein